MEQKEMIALLKSQMHMTYAERNEIAVHMNALSERLHQQEAEIEKLVQERGTMRASSPTMEWISVEDRLPGTSDNVLVYVSDIRKIYMAFYFDGLWWQYPTPCIGVNTVTHWMPLPEPPKPKVPTFKDMFLKAFPKAVCADVDCCTIFPKQFNPNACNFVCEECWNQPYFEEEEGEADAVD